MKFHSNDQVQTRRCGHRGVVLDGHIYDTVDGQLLLVQFEDSFRRRYAATDVEEPDE